MTSALVTASVVPRLRCGMAQLLTLDSETLAEAEELRQNDLVFPSATGRRMSDNTLSKLLRDLGIDAVPHGFRTRFRVWRGESGQPRELAESTLAHTIGKRRRPPMRGRTW